VTETPKQKKKSDKRIKDVQIKFFVERSTFKKLTTYCDRVKATKSDVLREYIDFLIEHPELEEYGTGKELLEKMLAALKASPAENDVHDSCTGG
jgi:hypothetical protein